VKRTRFRPTRSWPSLRCRPPSGTQRWRRADDAADHGRCRSLPDSRLSVPAPRRAAGGGPPRSSQRCSLAASQLPATVRCPAQLEDRGDELPGLECVAVRLSRKLAGLPPALARQRSGPSLWNSMRRRPPWAQRRWRFTLAQAAVACPAARGCTCAQWHLRLRRHAPVGRAELGQGIVAALPARWSLPGPAHIAPPQRPARVGFGT